MPSDPISESELAEMERRYQAATAEPWFAVQYADNWEVQAVSSDYGAPSIKLNGPSLDFKIVPCVSTEKGRQNMEFCAHARQDVPRLVDEVRRLRDVHDHNATVVKAQKHAIELLRAEVERLQAAVEHAGVLLTCGACGVVFSVETSKQPCNMAHRESWPHEWRTPHETQAWNEVLRLHARLVNLHRQKCTSDNCVLDGGPEHEEAFCVAALETGSNNVALH